MTRALLALLMVGMAGCSSETGMLQAEKPSPTVLTKEVPRNIVEVAPLTIKAMSTGNSGCVSYVYITFEFHVWLNPDAVLFPECGSSAHRVIRNESRYIVRKSATHQFYSPSFADAQLKRIGYIQAEIEIDAVEAR